MTKHDIESREDIDLLMQRFYTRVLVDDLIGYIFTDVAKLDLETHLPIIGDFWENLLFRTGDYARHGRSPMMVHAELNNKEPLERIHFQRWLEIFSTTVDENFAGANADIIKGRAVSIGTRFLNFIRGVPPLTPIGDN